MFRSSFHGALMGSRSRQLVSFKTQRVINANARAGIKPDETLKARSGRYIFPNIARPCNIFPGGSPWPRPGCVKDPGSRCAMLARSADINVSNGGNIANPIVENLW